MIRILVTIAFLLFSSSYASSAQTQVKTNAPPAPNPITKEASAPDGKKLEIGGTVGLIVLNNYGKEDFVHFYNEDGSLWYKFTYYYGDGDGKFEYANDDFSPFAFHADYFLLALKCVGKKGGRYEVIVNEETGLKKYVRTDDAVLKLETWEEHVLKVFAVTFNQEENPLLKAPQGKVKKGPPPDAPLHPVEVQGEWLKVKWYAPSGTGGTEPRHDFGWIKWRRGERLLVELFYIA